VGVFEPPDLLLIYDSFPSPFKYRTSDICMADVVSSLPPYLTKRNCNTLVNISVAAVFFPRRGWEL
jgi:hypothetical protein